MAGYNRKGTMDVLSLIDSQAELKTVTQFGEDKLWTAVEDSFKVHNQIAMSLFSEFVEVTTDQLRRWGNEIKRKMGRLDEYGASDVSKTMVTPANVGFPLYAFGDAIQWTRTAFLNMKVTDLTKEVRAIQTADIQNLIYQIKVALTDPTNNLAYVDRLVDGVTLPLRSLINGDGTPIPRNPNTGEEFNPDTHTHYLVDSTMDQEAVLAAINTVMEHGVVGTLRLIISPTDESTMTSVSGFTPYVPTGIVQASTESYATGQQFDYYRPHNRPIGVIGGAEVWVKHWWIPNYILVYDTAPSRKVLCMRKRAGTDMAGFGQLQLVYDNENFPLRANQYVREFGMSVNDRSCASVTFIDNGGVYTAPSISAPF